MYRCWIRIVQRRGERMIQSWILSSRLATITSMRSMASGTVQSRPRSQQANSQGFTIWSRGKAILKRKIPESLYWQLSTFEGSSTPTIKTIKKSRQRHLTSSIWLRRWLGYPLHPGRQPRNEANLLGPRRPQQRNVADLLGPPPP